MACGSALDSSLGFGSPAPPVPHQAALSLNAPGSLLGAPAPASTALGVNYNGELWLINKADLERIQAKWVRGFVDYHLYFRGSPAVKANIMQGLDKLHELHMANYKTIINIKIDFSNPPTNFPQGAAITAELSDLDALLTRLYPDCDVLVIGNEPFIESNPSDRGVNLINFYQQFAYKVKDFRDQAVRTGKSPTPLYLGAYDNLSVLADPAWQTNAKPLLQFTADNASWLEGADLHIHHILDSDIQVVFDFVNARLAPAQTILVTEFSLKNYFKQQTDTLNVTIPSTFATQYGLSPQTPVWSFLNTTLQPGQAVSRNEWVDLLQQSPWFESNKHYLLTAWSIFNQNPRFRVATYALYQTGPLEFQRDNDPWILNPIFVNQTVVPNNTTQQPQFNYTFGDDFRAIQKGP